MSTRAIVAVENADNTIYAIYCHNDGYTDHMLDVLNKSYSTYAKALELVKLGDVSYVGNNIAPDPKLPHTFDNSQPDTVVAYYRDRHDNWSTCGPELFNDLSEFTQVNYGDQGIEYTYLLPYGKHNWVCW